MKEDAYEAFRDYLAQHGLNMTSQRKTLLEVFMDEKDHVSAEDFYTRIKQMDESIGQATVYRTLKLLVESGLARQVNFGDGVARYEPQYGQAHHDHLICERCGKSIEILVPAIEELQEKTAQEHGFTLTNHRMILFGICPECQKATPAAS